MENSKNLKDIFCSSKKIALFTHVNPDGDAIGSTVGLAHVIRNCSESEVRIITPNRTPVHLGTIKGFDMVTDYIAKTAQCDKYIADCDLLVCVDFSDYNSRVGNLTPAIEANEKALKIVFDHHMSPDLSPFFVAYCDEKESSAAHVVLRALKENDMLEYLDNNAATALYTGMMTDTGNFSYGNLSAEMYRNIAILIEKGVDPTEVNNRIFNVRRENSLRLNGYATEKKMIVNYPAKAAVITLTAKELTKFGYASGDTEGLVNLPLSIEGINNAALFIEQDGFVKVSLRSTKGAGKDVNQFARKYFNGGGHINAAGGRAFNTTVEQCAELFIRNIDRRR
ncbi:MAG: bifunctional oligoribonuclease/PAP phosphatase NrnA [Rikenellaceae bacterium]